MGGEVIFHSGFTPDSVNRATGLYDGTRPMLNSPQSPLGQFEKNLTALRTPSRFQQSHEPGEMEEAREDMLHSKYMSRREINFGRDDPTGEKRAGIARAAARAQARVDAARASKPNLAALTSTTTRTASTPKLVSSTSCSSFRMREKPLQNLPTQPSTFTLTTPSPLTSSLLEHMRPQTSAERTHAQGLNVPHIPTLRQIASDSRLNESYLTLVTVLSPTPSQTSLHQPTDSAKKITIAKEKVKKGFFSVTNSVKALGHQIYKLSPRIDIGSQNWGRSPKAKHRRMMASILKGETVISGPVGDIVHDYQVEGQFKEQVKSAVYEGSIPLVRKPIMSELGRGAATVAEIQSGEGNPIEYDVSGLKYWDISTRESPRSVGEPISRLPTGVSRSQLPITPVDKRPMPDKIDAETPSRIERGIIFEENLFAFENGFDLDSRVFSPVGRDFAASRV